MKNISSRYNIKYISSRYDINRPWRRHGHKYIRYKICLSTIMVICIKQQLSNIWSSIHEKISNTEDELKKALLIKKASTSSLAKICVFPFFITVLFFPDKYVSRSFP